MALDYTYQRIVHGDKQIGSKVDSRCRWATRDGDTWIDEKTGKPRLRANGVTPISVSSIPEAQQPPDGTRVLLSAGCVPVLASTDATTKELKPETEEALTQLITEWWSGADAAKEAGEEYAEKYPVRYESPTTGNLVTTKPKARVMEV